MHPTVRIAHWFTCMALGVLMLGCTCRYDCMNGICVKRVCSCDVWYEGNSCERLVLSRYEAKYTGDLVTASFDTTIQAQFTALADPPGTATFGELLLEFTDVQHFRVSEQRLGSITVRGEGQMQYEAISMNLNVSIADDHEEEGVLTANRLED